MAEKMLVRSFCHLGDRWCNCIRHYFVPAGWNLTLPSVVAARETLSLRMSQIHRSPMPNTCRYEGSEFEFTDADGNIIDCGHSTNGNGPGLQIGDVLPTQLAMLVVLQTAGPTRSRGLTYLPFIAETFNGPGGVLTSGGLANIAAQALRLRQTIADSLGRSWVPAVWRRGADVLVAVSGSVGRPSLAQQRRRGIYWPSDPAPPWF